MRGEPALQRGVDQHRQAVVAHLLDPCGPGVGAPDLLRCGADHQPPQSLRHVEAEPLAGEPADREPTKITARNLQRIPKRNHVLAQVGHAVRAGRRFGVAVTTAVVAQDAVVRRKRLQLHVPHVQVGAKRVAEGQPGAPFGAIQAVMQAMCRQLEKCHGPPSGEGEAARTRSIQTDAMPRQLSGAKIASSCAGESIACT